MLDFTIYVFLCSQYFAYHKNRPYAGLSLHNFVSDRTLYETTGNRRGSCHLTEIGTLAIHLLTLQD